MVKSKKEQSKSISLDIRRINFFDPACKVKNNLFR
jgi:hypothetical protein